MNTRRLGRTGFEVSEIGYGAWGIGGTGWLGADDDESVKALRRAIDLGCNLIDTALGYGDGHSEELVGRIAREREERIYVTTKIPPKNRIWPAPDGIDPEDAYPADHVIACTEQSLRNTGLDALDVQQFHVWSDEWAERGTWQGAIARLKEEGKIRALGISINDHQPSNALRLIETGLVDTVQVIYNLFDQSPEDELFGACAEHDIGVLARVPLDEGALTGRIGPSSTFPEGDFRNRYFGGDRKAQVAERVDAILDELGIEREALAETALRYVLSAPEVSSVIPGMRSVRNVERNMAVGDGRGLPEDIVSALKAHRWDRNFYVAA
jgi:aryl-alcohol dehydrogenase-like predicted oxidoreductase